MSKTTEMDTTQCRAYARKIASDFHRRLNSADMALVGNCFHSLGYTEAAAMLIKPSTETKKLDGRQIADTMATLAPQMKAVMDKDNTKLFGSWLITLGYKRAADAIGYDVKTGQYTTPSATVRAGSASVDRGITDGSRSARR